MKATPTWRVHLLGSLLGQLQLATYLTVFVGFTGASSAGLWLSQRSLLTHGEAELSASAASLETCLTAHNLLEAQPAQRQQIRQELRDHSSVRTILWLEGPNGEMLLPSDGHLPSKRAVLEKAMAANPQRQERRTEAISLFGREYVSALHRRFPSGHRLWTVAEVSTIQRAQAEFLNWMILIWGGCLVLSLLVITRLVRRIVEPLQQLRALSSQLTADTLNTAATGNTTSIAITAAPLEVAQLARTFNNLLARLAQSWEHQRQFVSAVSHELRTPLTIVQGYLHRTLRRNQQLDSHARQGLTVAEDECLRLGRMLNDLLDLSRNDSGQLALSQTSIALPHAVRDAVDLARSTSTRTIELELDLKADQGSVLAHADPTRLRQVLLDLIENAEKYSPADTPIVVRLSTDNARALIAVEDQGIGIPASELPLVFERFQRGSNTGTRSGSGLGLSVVKLLVEAMQGEISVRSTLGQGSCFQVSLPLDCRELPHVLTCDRGHGSPGGLAERSSAAQKVEN